MKVLSNVSKLVARWGPALLVMGIIFTFSSLPSSVLPSLDGPIDLILKKSGHMIIYATLALFLYRGFDRPDKREGIIWSWVVAVLFAITDEYHQSFVAGRGASLIDIGIDAVGAALGLLLLYYR